MTKEERRAYNKAYREAGLGAQADRRWYMKNAKKKREQSRIAYMRKKFSEELAERLTFAK